MDLVGYLGGSVGKHRPDHGPRLLERESQVGRRDTHHLAGGDEAGDPERRFRPSGDDDPEFGGSLADQGLHEEGAPRLGQLVDIVEEERERPCEGGMEGAGQLGGEDGRLTEDRAGHGGEIAGEPGDPEPEGVHEALTEHRNRPVRGGQRIEGREIAVRPVPEEGGLAESRATADDGEPVRLGGTAHLLEPRALDAIDPLGNGHDSDSVQAGGMLPLVVSRRRVKRIRGHRAAQGGLELRPRPERPSLAGPDMNDLPPQLCIVPGEQSHDEALHRTVSTACP